MTIPRRLLLGAVAWAALAAGVCAGLSGQSLAHPVAAVSNARGAPVRHVVIVGLSGLRWNEVSAAKTPALWRLAEGGSVGSLVDYAEYPLACPADGWLTLNSGARSAGTGPCGTLPTVLTAGGGRASIPAMPRLIEDDEQFHQNPDWGLLGRLGAGTGGNCGTAVGPGAALALAAPSGAVDDYVQSPTALDDPGLAARVLARCQLTVIDLSGAPSAGVPGARGNGGRGAPLCTEKCPPGLAPHPERPAPSPPDEVLSRIVAELPPGTLLLVTAPSGQCCGSPHLLTTVVSGPGYAGGLLTAASTRQPGIVTLTDLAPTVAHWLGESVPGYLTGSVIARGDRGPLPSAVRALDGRDVAEQVWMGTHAWFLLGYAVADVAAFGIPALILWGRDAKRRRRRAACWRVAGVFAVAVPVATFLAGLVPWWEQSHPVAWLYGMAAAWTLILGCAALRTGSNTAAKPGEAKYLGAFGQICLVTLILLGVDVMTGSRLQLETPFGLSLLESGRYYGIGNNALGVYCVSALVGAIWLGMLARDLGRRRLAVALASAVGVFAVVASGWPGFGAKVGGTIAMVPCFLVLILALAGVRVRWRYAVPVALSGLALFAVFAIVSYVLPAAGVSDIGSFAGNLLHGHGGAVLERKASSNLGTLTASAAAPLVPVVVLALAIALWRPGLVRLRTMPLAFESQPLLRVAAWLAWLVLVIGWLADDSGVMVPAVALPFAVPLVFAMSASVFFGLPESAILKEPSPGLPSQVTP